MPGLSGLSNHNWERRRGLEVIGVCLGLGRGGPVAAAAFRAVAIGPHCVYVKTSLKIRLGNRIRQGVTPTSPRKRGEVKAATQLLRKNSVRARAQMPTIYDFRNRIAVVTGGAQGI